jgi:hypothetical protein
MTERKDSNSVVNVWPCRSLHTDVLTVDPISGVKLIILVAL